MNTDRQQFRVTVGIIVRNEARHIGETLDHLLRLDFDPDAYEILIVDGNSSDGTQEIIRSVIAANPQRCVRLIVEEAPRGHGAARNLVLENARGDLVAFTDADCRAAPDWLAKLIEVFEREHAADPKVIASGGIRYPVQTEHWKERVLNAMFETYLGSGGSAGFVLRRSTFVDSIANYNVLYLKSVALAEKYLPLHFGEDFEFNRRLTSKGYKLALSPEPKVYHHQEHSLSAFTRQMFHYGRSQARVWKLTGHVRLFAPLMTLFVIGMAAGWTTLFFSTPLFLGYLIIAGCYLLAVAFTTLGIVWRERSLSSLLALYLFPLQHVAYAIGFLRGMLTGRRR